MMTHEEQMKQWENERKCAYFFGCSLYLFSAVLIGFCVFAVWFK